MKIIQPFVDRSRAEVQDKGRETESRGGQDEGGGEEEGWLGDRDGEKQQLLSSACPRSKYTAASMSRTQAASTCTKHTQLSFLW